jgi:hypothetical protein
LFFDLQPKTRQPCFSAFFRFRLPFLLPLVYCCQYFPAFFFRWVPYNFEDGDF